MMFVFAVPYYYFCVCGFEFLGEESVLEGGEEGGFYEGSVCCCAELMEGHF